MSDASVRVGVAAPVVSTPVRRFICGPRRIANTGNTSNIVKHSVIAPLSASNSNVTRLIVPQQHMLHSAAQFGMPLALDSRSLLLQQATTERKRRILAELHSSADLINILPQHRPIDMSRRSAPQSNQTIVKSNKSSMPKDSLQFDRPQFDPAADIAQFTQYAPLCVAQSIMPSTATVLNAACEATRAQNTSQELAPLAAATVKPRRQSASAKRATSTKPNASVGAKSASAKKPPVARIRKNPSALKAPTRSHSGTKRIAARPPQAKAPRKSTKKAKLDMQSQQQDIETETESCVTQQSTTTTTNATQWSNDELDSLADDLQREMESELSEEWSSQRDEQEEIHSNETAAGEGHSESQSLLPTIEERRDKCGDELSEVEDEEVQCVRRERQARFQASTPSSSFAATTTIKHAACIGLGPGSQSHQAQESERQTPSVSDQPSLAGNDSIERRFNSPMCEILDDGIGALERSLSRAPSRSLTQHLQLMHDQQHHQQQHHSMAQRHFDLPIPSSTAVQIQEFKSPSKALTPVRSAAPFELSSSPCFPLPPPPPASIDAPIIEPTWPPVELEPGIEHLLN